MKDQRGKVRDMAHHNKFAEQEAISHVDPKGLLRKGTREDLGCVGPWFRSLC
jgi:hypothetical protein